MKRLTLLVSSAFILGACQAPVQNTVAITPVRAGATLIAAQTQQPVILDPIVTPRSPVLAQIKVKPQGVIKIQNSKVNVSIQLPALSDYAADFKTQALYLDNAAKIVATVSDSHGQTYTPVGAVAGEVNYPAGGSLNLTFENVVPDQLLFVELQVKDGTGNIPQAELASVVSQTGITDVNAAINFQTTPTAKAMKALANANATRARAVSLTDMVAKMAEITGVAGTSPNFTYTTHPTLVNTAQLATDLAATAPAALTAATYRLVGGTLALTVQGLVGADTLEVQSTDAASAQRTGLGNGASSITGTTPGTGLTARVGATTGNSTQYTFALSSPTVDFTNNASTNLTVTATPVAVTLTNVAPTAGAIGSSVTLTGSGFSTTAANNVVEFGGTAATVVSVNPAGTQIVVTVPAGVFGANAVNVQVGSQTSGNVNYNVQPTIASLSTSSGVIGSNVTITGTGFHTTAGSNTVEFGGTAATVVSVNPAGTQIVATVPAGASGQENVTVQVGTQTNTGTNNFNVTPVLTSLAANNGVPGTPLVLTGTGFSATNATNVVRFGTATATVTNVNAAKTQLTVTIPNVAGAQNVNVQVGSQTSGNQTFNSTPSITSLNTTTGSTGDSITLTGVGFDATDANNTVKFGTATATITSATSTQIVATLTEAPAGTANATVEVGTQTSAISGFAVLPKITALATATTEGGKAVLIRSEVLTITGTNFDPTNANNTVQFGTGTPVAVLTASATSITVMVPANTITETPGDVAIRVITNSQNSNVENATVSSVQLNVTNGGFH